MARQNKISMPSGTGGLVRYFDDYKSKFSIPPMHVIVFIVIVAMITILLHVFGLQLLGFR